MTLVDATIAYFDSVAERYDEVLPFFAAFAANAVTLLNLAPGSRVLDVGAGRGAFTERALARGSQVTAVDAAPRMVDLLRRDFPAASCEVMDAHRLDLSDESFDDVVSAFVIHILPDPRRAACELARVTASSGHVALLVPGRHDEQPDAWTDPVHEVVREFRAFQADGSGRHSGGDYESEEQLLRDAGLLDVHGVTLEVALPVPDGDTYWRWMNSHGAGAFTRNLPAHRRAQFRSRVMQTVDDHGGLVLRRSAALWVGTK